MIRAVTFDFWDTIAFDDSDEPKRAARGLPTKAVAREALFVEELLRHHPAIGPDAAARAYADCNAWFTHCWKIERHTPTVATRLARGFASAGVDPTPGFDALVAAFEEMEVQIPPDPTPGVAACVTALSERYRLAIISDTIVTPGRGLQRLLDSYGILHRFDAFVFSDEVGASKPARAVFDRAAADLGVGLAELVHVGDRESNDVAGPHEAGARAILYTGAIDRGSANTRADAVCWDLAELPSLVAGL